MTDSDDWRAINRASWNRRTPLHLASRFYDLDAWKRGACSLKPIELEEVGDVRGCRLLHLQCHFGQDTLSWARRGASVVGLDFSDAAITAARDLATEVGLSSARFVQSDVLEASRAVGETFDIVFTSYGVLCWLPDLDPWAREIAACLRPGGRFHLVEFHPLAYIFDDALEKVTYPWDSKDTPIRTEETRTYADPDTPVQLVDVSWNHGIGTVVSALLRAGLVLDSLREHDWMAYPIYPSSREIAPGRYQVDKLPGAPLTYSLQAHRPA
ncbi:class I SAM-dependent methyltransferase [Chondromyces crocatus]|uniref:Methyltransferase type 12 n=1 Tax=Chondromyces crocatus TaxID=52 RepID=A0A0K1EPP5_CHOCO|nr:class I SAM-dependent methyltransferase [Chondromyces crocatus]AKT42831.1 methyltransferase type 12 [Chondromyces crocatus]